MTFDMSQGVQLPAPKGAHPNAGFLFGSKATGWLTAEVVRVHALEEIGAPFRYDITLRRAHAQGSLSIDELVDTAASFAVRGSRRWRQVHGVIAEAEEIERRQHHDFYRVLLVPHWWRALYRRRCRSFVHKTLREIIESVLENRATDHPEGLAGLESFDAADAPLPPVPSTSSYQPGKGYFRWAMETEGRLDNRDLRAHVVQYNESDFAFIGRLLEEEGISYLFEEAADGTVMTLTDHPGRMLLSSEVPGYRLVQRLEAGEQVGTEIVHVLRRRRRMRPLAVKMRDFDWNKSRTQLEHEAAPGGDGHAGATHYEFPARDENEGAAPCRAPAEHRRERFEAERAMCTGIGSLRSMVAGTRFAVRDDAGLRQDVELVAARVETYAVEIDHADGLLGGEEFGFEGYERDPNRGPYCEVHFDALPSDHRYRPEPDATPRPRINGIQTAIVTAEEVSEDTEIHCDEQGRVRVRFPWDQRPPDGTPSSKWVRVSHGWAGNAFGHVYTPRVGDEVLVAFLQGDPDRPVILGRVYNPQWPPPYDVREHKTRSTIKSHSSPNAEGFNELQFEDLAGEEHIFLHAQKDLRERVLNDHSTHVGHDQSNHVEHDQSNQVDHNRTHGVIGTEDVTVGGDRTTYFKSNETHTTDLDRKTMINQNETLVVEQDRRVTVNGAINKRHVPSGYEHIDVMGNRYVWSRQNHQFKSFLNSNTFTYLRHTTTSTDHRIYVHSTFTAQTEGGFSIQARGHNIFLNTGAGAEIAMMGDRIVIDCAELEINTSGNTIIRAGGEVLENGTHVKMNC